RLVDCFRRLHPDRQGAYTCWNTQTGARENNYGTRIDYIIAEASLADRALRDCDIMPEFLGSDHCPVRATFAMPPFPAPPSLTRADESENGTAPASAAESEWPEHPPECSCFYRELTAKQETLAKYFVAGAQPKEPPLDGDARRRALKNGFGEEEEADDGRGSRRGSPALPVSSRGVKGVGPFMRALPGATAAGVAMSNRAVTRTVRGEKLGVAGRASSSSSSSGSGSGSFRSSAARRLASGGSRQSKLTFGTASMKNRDGGGGGGGNGGKASSRVEDERVVDSSGHNGGGHGGGGGAPTRTFPTMGAMPSCSDPSTEDHVDGVPSGRVADRSGSNTNNAGPGGAVAADSAGSAEAWKALFGQKKSAPPCEHGEPSIQRTVLKPGPNYNRRFYTCARSAGNWPTDRNARCNFFQWRRDGVRGYKDRPPRDESSGNKRRRA
ncbi:unnamed protein product, partial [Hapterophycus canaliculatus]